jgi:hypothetical protein
MNPSLPHRSLDLAHGLLQVAYHRAILFMVSGVVLAVVQQASARSCGGHHVRTAGDERNGHMQDSGSYLAACFCIALRSLPHVNKHCISLQPYGASRLGMTSSEGFQTVSTTRRRDGREQETLATRDSTIPAIIIGTRPGVIAWLPCPCRYQRLRKKRKSVDTEAWPEQGT